jgi:hypothetical protein
MAITEPVYANRESVKRALDIMDTARANDQVDRLLGSATESVDGQLNRTFSPRIDTLEWDWLNPSSPTPWRLWLDDRELIEVLSLTSGGAAISTGNLVLYPNSGPPYNRVEIDISTTSSFSVGSTHQNAISLHGLFGYTLSLQSVGGLVSAINSSVGSIELPNGALVGVGDLLKADDEYLLVTERGWVDSTQNLQSPALTASVSNTTLAVTTGTSFNMNEVILLDSERMLIVDVAGNNLTVKRAWDGSVLAAHIGSDIYWSRSLTVLRGSVGSTAASHLISTPVKRWLPPPLVNQLCIAEALTGIEQEKSAYARVVGSGDNAFEGRGIGLADLRDMTCKRHGRHNRHRAV